MEPYGTAEANVANSRKKYNIVEFFGKTTHAEDYRPHSSAKPMSKLFRPFMRQFEPCRIPFESQTYYATTFSNRTPFDRPQIGAWARRDGDQALSANDDPLEVATSYNTSYRNPNVHVSSFDRPHQDQEKSCPLACRPVTAPQNLCRSQFVVETPKPTADVPSGANNNKVSDFHAEACARPSTTALSKRNFFKYQAVAFNGYPNYSSEYADRYRNYSGITNYCQRPGYNNDQTLPSL